MHIICYFSFVFFVETNVLQLANDKNLAFDGKTFVTKRDKRTGKTHGLLKNKFVNQFFTLSLPWKAFYLQNLL